MDKLTSRAFGKLQKREHLLRRIRDLRGLGRITQEEFKRRESSILDQYKLTPEEWQAYHRYNQIIKQRAR